MTDPKESSGQIQEPVVQEQNQEIEEKDVPYSTYKKAVTEKRNRDAELKQAKELLAKYELEKKALEEQALKEKEDYKKLFEARDSELNSERQKRMEIEGHITNTRKINSFLKTLNAPMKEQYFSLVDLDKIALDQDGRPDEIVLKQYADEFRKSYPEIFFAGTAKIPNESANGSLSAGLSYDQWLKLPVNEQKKRIKEVQF